MTSPHDTHHIRYPYTPHDPAHLDGIRRPVDRAMFVGDNWVAPKDSLAPVAVMAGFHHWKPGFVSRLLPEYRTVFLRRKMRPRHVFDVLRKLRPKPAIVIAWGRDAHPAVRLYTKLYRKPVYRMEDGFVRSADLGARHVPPYSLTLDKTGIYFDGTRPSDIEHLLNRADVSEQERADAGRLIDLIKALNISKYNLPPNPDAADFVPQSGKRYIVVLGQVAKDLSLKYGNPDGWDALKMVQLAAEEHPECEILFRPHPEEYAALQSDLGAYEAFARYATVTSPEITLSSMFSASERVYTISSLSGFEAVLNGIPATILGTPFYAGWGLTDDRVAMPRRTRQRTLQDFFALAYIRYPRYLTNAEDNAQGLFAACLLIDADRADLAARMASEPPVTYDACCALSEQADIHRVTRDLIRAVKHAPDCAERAVSLLHARFGDSSDVRERADVVRSAHDYVF